MYFKNISIDTYLIDSEPIKTFDSGSIKHFERFTRRSVQEKDPE